MNAVLCNSCGRLIGEAVASNEMPAVSFTLPSHKQPSHVWGIRCRPLAFRGFDPTRVHFCKPCLLMGVLGAINKQLIAAELEIKNGGAK